MYCPNISCQESAERPHLLITERSGIEIDYCPKCRGVWLDRGELDKLIERAQADVAQDQAPQQAAARGEQYQAPRDYQHHPKDHYQDRHYKDQSYGHYGKKKKSILSEIFDF
jgi:Zn-finger nucleic acid-binding protein